MLTKWKHPQPLFAEGILVGSDATQEWMLPWWWKHYSCHNSYPVVFVDFGLSEEARLWCEERGQLLNLEHYPLLKEREQLPPQCISQWENAYGTSFWKNRASWFKKPQALLMTPFEKTVWLDLDCEVRGPLASLFLESMELGLVPEPSCAHAFLRRFTLIEDNEVCYNSGVILYKHGSFFIQTWAEECFSRADYFWSDQNLLSRQLFESKTPVIALAPKYNWRMSSGENAEAHIIHWAGDVGKEWIFYKMQVP